MTWSPPKTNWLISDGVSVTDLDRIEENTRVLSQQGGPFGTTTNVGNAYSVTASPALTALVDGAVVSILLNASNTGNATLNVNGLGAKAVLKSNGNQFPSGGLVTNAIYTLRYSSAANAGSGAFILQGEGGGGGNAIAAHLLSGETATVDSGPITGSMVNNGAGNTVTPGTANQTRAAGFWSSLITILGDAALLAANIMVGHTIFGVAGTATADATAGDRKSVV